MDQQLQSLSTNARRLGEEYFQLLAMSSQFDFEAVENARLDAIQALNDLRDHVEKHRFVSPAKHEKQAVDGASSLVPAISLETVWNNSQTVQTMLHRDTQQPS